MEQFYFVLTERCNLTCSHCIRDSSPWRSEAGEYSMIIDAIGQIAKNYPESLILLSGGEPTIHRQFKEILGFSLRTGLDVNLNTNGTTSFFSVANLGGLTDTGRLSVQVSLDGDERTHDSIRGPGSFAKALRSIQRLTERGITCCVSTTVVDSDFLERADQFIQSLDEFGLAHIAIKRATYAGRAAAGVALGTGEWNRHVYRLREMPWKTRLRMSPMYDFNKLDSIPDAALAQLELPQASVNCGAGTAKVYIYGNGDVCPCTCFKDRPMGNLYEKSLSDILATPPHFEVKSETCSTCRYFALCRGGCLGSGYQTTGELGTPDPRCPKITSEGIRKRQVYALSLQ
ncbi:radical SAM protein [Paraburkholderia sp. SIMBA_049]